MIFRITKYSIKNILRNKFLSISSILVLTLLMFFINILVILHDVSFKLIDSVNSKMTISLYLNDEYDKNSLEVNDLMNSIVWVHSDIWVEYKSKELILDEIREKEPDLVEILERTNPLPDTIILSDIQIEYYKEVNSIIEPKVFILKKYEDNTDHFSHYSSQYKNIENIISVLGILTYGLYIIIWVFLLSIFIITYSIIGNFIYYFKDEIYITRLVWWSKKFIYGPFILQWMIYSFTSFVLSFFIFLFILSSINNAFGDLYMFEANYLILLLELFVFVLVWGISWLFSSKRYLK
jgi:cell division transport system permease protein